MLKHMKVLKFQVFTVVVALLFMAGVSSAAVRTVPHEPKNVEAKGGIVAAAHELASKAGLEIMEKGGNAIDAAAATALALNVVEPYNIGMGGGGFIVVRFAKTGEVVFLDFREVAPAYVTKDLYASEQAKKENWMLAGGKAVAVPGFVAGWFYALEKYGTMTFEQVMQPALRLAEEGYTWTETQYKTLTEGTMFPHMERLNGDCKHVPYMTADGLPLPPGSHVKLPGIAKAFKLLAKEGPKAFYEGPIGDAVIAAVNKNGGSMTKQDLSNYKVRVRKPVEGTYRGYKIFSAAPPSSGGTHIIEMLNFMENFDLAKIKAGSPELFNMWGHVQRMIFADRDKFMADPEFAKVPLAGLTSKEYAKTLVERYNQEKDKLPEVATPGDPWKFEPGAAKTSDVRGLGREHFSTTHFSTVDREGNIVAATNTINYWYGSGIFVPEYQLPVNNQMDDFSSNPESVNAPEPGKTPLSSMSPTILLDPQGRAFMTVGAAGSKMILTVVAQVITNVIDHKMSMSQAIEFPRIWTDMKGETILEETAGPEVFKDLEAKGYKFKKDNYYGVCQGIVFYQDKGIMEGASDQRPGTGMPAGF